ncbi:MULTISPECIES: hypothetical protein [Acidovorax]|uniref:hypothetical protein n=1 Tax=Acidovorax TaxID=12916 RepID=UPI000237660A|nr:MULTISPECIES: hypothetical protein [Acidovorax]KRD50232.1 hypothetical protein ASE52_08430 [Acidovorax sp. Root275]MBD9395690.1 hypothetical protein [Acidovorax sp. ACV01]
MTTNPTTNFPIDRVLAAFEKGDVPTLLGSVADDMDFRIDHYRDDADTSWQVARNKADLLAVVQRLGTEIFPRGTKIVHTHSQPLGNDWVITQFHQRFFYAVQQREVESLTWIVSHSQNGQLDYFRETVTTITPT